MVEVLFAHTSLPLTFYFHSAYKHENKSKLSPNGVFQKVNPIKKSISRTENNSKENIRPSSILSVFTTL